MSNQPLDQQIDNAEGLGIRQLRQMQQTNPELVVGVALENLQQELIANERQRQMDMRPDATPPDVIGQTYNEVSSMLGGAGQSPELQPPSELQQPPMAQQGIPQLPAQNMAMGAQGGIVGYADGGSVQPIPALMDKYGSEMVMGFLEGEKELREESNYVAPEYADAYKQKRDNFYSHYPQGFLEDVYETRGGQIDISEELSMAGGGIVSLQQGGLLEVGDRTQEGELIVAMVKGVMGVMPVTEAEYKVWEQGGRLPSNRNRPIPTFRQAVKDGLGIDLPRVAPVPGSPEENLMQGNTLTGPDTGNVLQGPGGLASEIGEIMDSDTHWSEKVGEGAVATTEAGIQALLKAIGGGWEGIEYGGRLIGGAGKGAGKQLATKGREQAKASPAWIEAAIESASAQFTSDMAPLSAQLNELQNTPINRDIDPDGKQRAAAMAAIQDRRDQLQAQYESAVANLKEDNPTFGGSVMNIPQDILGWMEGYEDNPTDTWVGRKTAEYLGEEQREEQRIEGLNTAAQAKLAANAGAAAPVTPVTPVTPAGWLAEQQREFDASEARSQRSSVEREEVVGGGEEQEKRNWLDKTLDVMELLGQGGGASKGYEFAQINERQAAQRALTEANEFDMAKQQALLNQRTEERNMILDMQAKIARADALAEINETLHQRVLSDPARERYKESIIKESKGNYWMPFAYNEVWVDSQMADWDIAKFEELQQQAMAPVNASLGIEGGGATPPPAAVPPNVTVTRSP